MKDFNDDAHLDVCQNIEVGLKDQYERHPGLTDVLAVFALDNAKVAVKKAFGYAGSQKVTDHPLAQGIIDWCVALGVERVGKVNDLTLSEYLERIEKIRRSVSRHSTFGTRAYYEFIRNYL